MFFLFIFEFFSTKVRKNSKFEKVENMMKKQSILKKRFNPSKRHLQQCWRAQNIPEVAGCLVLILRKMQQTHKYYSSDNMLGTALVGAPVWLKILVAQLILMFEKKCVLV